VTQEDAPSTRQVCDELCDALSQDSIRSPTSDCSVVEPAADDDASQNPRSEVEELREALRQKESELAEIKWYMQGDVCSLHLSGLANSAPKHFRIGTPRVSVSSVPSPDESLLSARTNPEEPSRFCFSQPEEPSRSADDRLNSGRSSPEENSRPADDRLNNVCFELADARDEIAEARGELAEACRESTGHVAQAREALARARAELTKGQLMPNITAMADGGPRPAASSKTQSSQSSVKSTSARDSGARHGKSPQKVDRALPRRLPICLKSSRSPKTSPREVLKSRLAGIPSPARTKFGPDPKR